MAVLHLGAPPEAISEASARLEVTFPPELEAIWLVANGVELPSGWQIYPVFDRSNARKTSNDIVYENTRGRWDSMDPSLLSIAGNGTGNQLVLKREGRAVSPVVHVWNHETSRTKLWSSNLGSILQAAERRVGTIKARIARRTGQGV